MRASGVMQLIRQLHSPDSKLVLQAVEELRARGWLSDGSLEGASLQYVHLEGADLYKADLRGVDLQHAYLDGANLSLATLARANLSGANLQSADLSRADLAETILYKVNLYGARNVKEEQLALANRLRGATLPNGNRYDGRYNLPGDLALAQADGIEAGNPAAMAEYYGVPLEVYEHGQAIMREKQAGTGSWFSTGAIRTSSDGLGKT